MVNACFVEFKKLGYAHQFDCLYAWFSFSKGVLGSLVQLDLFLLFDKAEKEEFLFGFWLSFFVSLRKTSFAFKRNFFVDT